MHINIHFKCLIRTTHLDVPDNCSFLCKTVEEEAVFPVAQGLFMSFFVCLFVCLSWPSSHLAVPVCGSCAKGSVRNVTAPASPEGPDRTRGTFNSSCAEFVGERACVGKASQWCGCTCAVTSMLPQVESHNWIRHRHKICRSDFVQVFHFGLTLKKKKKIPSRCRPLSAS